MKENYIALHTQIDDMLLNGETVLRIEKNDKLDRFDENTYCKLKDISFHNGIIEIDMLARLLPDAAPFARGFIGIVFRANEGDNEFEGFYVRPTNGRNCDDPVRRSHGCQYFAYPGYTFAYFREYGIDNFESPVVDIDLDEWISLKADIQDEHADFYINGNHVLTVEHMKHGKNTHGSIGLYVDNGTEGFFRNLRVTCAD